MHESGKLLISEDGKLRLTGEIFDKHGTYPFEAFIDTGNSFGLVVTKELADAVCAVEVGVVPISTLAGTGATHGIKRIANLRFGTLTLEEYPVIAVDGTRNLVGIPFFQDTGIAILADFHKGKTQGSIVTSDRELINALGKTAHCYVSHYIDITNSAECCPYCGAIGE